MAQATMEQRLGFFFEWAKRDRAFAWQQAQREEAAHPGLCKRLIAAMKAWNGFATGEPGGTDWSALPQAEVRQQGDGAGRREVRQRGGSTPVGRVATPAARRPNPQPAEAAEVRVGPQRAARRR